MKAKMIWKERVRRTGCILGMVLIGALAPLAAQAGQSTAPNCDALVSWESNLYLAATSGKILAQFTLAGTPKDYAALAPDGRRVAFTTKSNETSYQVADIHGRQNSFPIYSTSPSGNGSSSEASNAEGPLMGLSWSTNDVIRLEKHVSPTASRFEFHHIERDLEGSSPLVGSPGGGDICVLRKKNGQIACLQGEDVSIDGTNVYTESEFSGVPPVASFTLAKGESADTPGNPSYKVTVIGFDKDGVGLKVTYPYADGAGEEMYVPPGYFLKVGYMYNDYGFFPTIINKKTGLVRIDEVKVALGSATFDPALAWQPHGPGLLLIRRTDTQAMLILIQPREIDQQKHKGRGKNDKWSVVAKTSINMPESVQMMRFATPSLLLLKTTGGQFDEMALRIRNGSSDNGQPTLTTGALKSLPAIISVTTNGKPKQAPVLDWSCKSSHGDDEQDD